MASTRPFANIVEKDNVAITSCHRSAYANKITGYIVIGIHEGKVSSSRNVNSCIAGSTDPYIFLVNYMYKRGVPLS